MPATHPNQRSSGTTMRTGNLVRRFQLPFHGRAYDLPADYLPQLDPVDEHFRVYMYSCCPEGLAEALDREAFRMNQRLGAIESRQRVGEKEVSGSDPYEEGQKDGGEKTRPVEKRARKVRRERKREENEGRLLHCVE
ncbi:MAG: hypothetical protein Q9162_004486 [Coniocarpon cinnabarinum]